MKYSYSLKEAPIIPTKLYAEKLIFESRHESKAAKLNTQLRLNGI
jgi:hypothetical protein